MIAGGIMRTLYPFPIPHYGEKTRWHLDHKGPDFQVDNLFPGLHRLKSKRLADIVTLPILKNGEQVIGDFSQIALYLEQTYTQYRCCQKMPRNAPRCWHWQRISTVWACMYGAGYRARSSSGTR
jgi:glutathione S-transferase